MRISWIPAASLLLALILTACAAGETGAPAEEYMPDAAGANTAVSPEDAAPEETEEHDR